MSRKVLEKDLEQINQLLNDIVGVSKYEQLSRLGGLTNHTYKVTTEKGDFILRIPGEGTEELINRNDEKVSTELACKLGIDTELLYFGDRGEKVTRYINDAITMSPETMKEEQNIIDAAQIFKTLHTSNVDTKVPFEVFDMAKSYEDFLENNNVAIYDDYSEIREQVKNIKAIVDAENNISLVPCHNDPLCENWIIGNGRMYLIDWEYAGMNDGMWDLADVSIEANYSEKEDHILLKSYLGCEPTTKNLKHFLANKIYLDYLWTLWGKTRVPFDGQPMEDYALERYNRLKVNIKEFNKMKECK